MRPQPLRPAASAQHGCYCFLGLAEDVERFGVVGLRRQAHTLGVSYEFLFMQASGDQLRKIAQLVDDGTLRPVVGQVFPFDEVPRGLEALVQGELRGKIVVTNP